MKLVLNRGVYCNEDGPLLMDSFVREICPAAGNIVEVVWGEGDVEILVGRYDQMYNGVHFNVLSGAVAFFDGLYEKGGRDANGWVTVRLSIRAISPDGWYVGHDCRGELIVRANVLGVWYKGEEAWGGVLRGAIPVDLPFILPEPSRMGDKVLVEYKEGHKLYKEI